MTRCAMSARSQGKLYTHRMTARLERDACGRAFVDGLAPEVEGAVRERPLRRLNGFHCDLQAMYAPLSPDEAVSVDGDGLNARDAAVKATGPNPHMSVCGRPFRLGDPDDTGGVR